MTYYDRLNAFFDRNDRNPLVSSAQLVYLHLLHENNRLQNPGRFRLSDAELVYRTGYSRQTITTAKRVLKNGGWINFETDRDNPRAGTVYILPDTEKKPRVENNVWQIETPLEIISADLWKAWKLNNDGVAPSETEMHYLADDVKLHGEDKVRRAIEQAGQKKRGSLSIYFYHMQLADIVSGKESTGNVRQNRKGVNPRIASQYSGFGADEAPVD